MTLPRAWLAILDRDVPFYASLRPDERARFDEKLEAIVRTKDFSAGPGITIDDRVKVVIGAVAARLTMNIAFEELARLTCIVVHAGTFEDGEGDALLGSASYAFSVRLSWPEVLAGLAAPHDGTNVGFHEFAHVLDASDGISDGVPPLLLKPGLRRTWIRVFKSELAALRAASADGSTTLLDRYGAQDEAELFAVATELFFERPRDMRERHPDLFTLLTEYFGQVPREP